MSKIDTSSWKKFKISELFVSENGNVDIQKAHINGKGIDVVSSGLANNGIIGKSDLEARIFPAGTLTVDMFGNVFYRDAPYKMVTHARVFSLALKDPSVIMDEKTGLFLATSMSFLSKLHSFSNMATFAKISGMEISLPVTMEEAPDWDYMRKHIAELERERIAELERERIAGLEQYLAATGLNDYVLTDNEKTVLNKPAVMYGFRMGSLFDILSPKQKYNANAVVIDKTGQLGHPYVVRMSDKNGIRGSIEGDTDKLNPARTFSFGQDTATVFWQTAPYFTGDKIKVLQPRYDLTDEMAQYIISSIQRSFSNFLWGQQSFSEKAIKNVEVILPIQTDAAGQPVIDPEKMYHPDGFMPDWKYMAAYIRAIEKLVIKDMVDLKDAFIAQARSVVGSESEVR